MPQSLGLPVWRHPVGRGRPDVDEADFATRGDHRSLDFGDRPLRGVRSGEGLTNWAGRNSQSLVRSAAAGGFVGGLEGPAIDKLGG